MTNLITLLRQEYYHPGFWYAFISGSLLGVGFIFPLLWWMSVIGGVGLLRVVRQELGVRRVVQIMLMAWGVKYLITLTWYTNIYPIEWIPGLSTVVRLLVVGTFWVTNALSLSVGGGVFGIVAYTVYHTKFVPKFLWYILVPFLWLGGELAGAVFFSLVVTGPGSYPQAYFSFGMIGYLLTETKLGILLAGIYGVWGLSILLICISSAILAGCHLRRQTQLLFFGLGVGLFLVVHFLPGIGRDVKNQGVTVISIDTTFDENQVTTLRGVKKRITQLDEAIAAAVALNADYVLLPEDSRVVAAEYSDISARQALNRFLSTYGSTSTMVIDSGRVDMPNGDTYLRATMFDGKRNQVYQFDKQYLVPQGEYIPYLSAVVLRLLGFGTLVDGFEKNSSYRPGPFTPLTQKTPAGVPGILFCFESVRPDGVTTLVQSGTVPFILHPLSHGWFHDPVIMWHELDSMLVIQARLSGVPIVSAGNLVSGKLYLPNGQIQTGEVVETGEGWLLRKFVF